MTLQPALWAAALLITAQTPDPDLPADYAASHEATRAAFSHHVFALEDGGRLGYHIREGEGPTLVLTPGTWGDYLSFNRLVPLLDPAFRVIVIEFRGQGDSSAPVAGATIESHSDDLMAVIAHLGLARYYLGGHSFGGMVTKEVAGRAPEGLVAAIPMEGWTHHTVQENAFGGVEFTLAPGHAAERAANRVRGLARLTDAEREEMGRIWTKWDGTGAIRTTPVPVLEIWGDRGMAVRPTMDAMQIPERPNLEVVWIANASHGYLVERPEAVAAAVNAFIARVEAASVTPPSR